MDRVTSLYKALDLLTILGGHSDGYRAAELAFTMNQPRTTVLRVLNSLVEYGLVRKEGKVYRSTPAFESWARRDRHAHLVRRYRPLLESIARQSGELVLLGVLEGAGVVHLDYIEQDKRVSVAPAPSTHHSIRHNAIGKLILSQRPDLAETWVSEYPVFAEELEEIQSTGVAWNHGETVSGIVAMATHGFSTAQTDAKIAVAWPCERFDRAQAESVAEFIREKMQAEP